MPAWLTVGQSNFCFIRGEPSESPSMRDSEVKSNF